MTCNGRFHPIGYQLPNVAAYRILGPSSKRWREDALVISKGNRIYVVRAIYSGRVGVAAARFIASFHMVAS
jgi:hypothetical protein